MLECRLLRILLLNLPVLVSSLPPTAARLLERGRRYQEKLAEAQRLAEEAPRDAATGQPLFKPKTHRPPIYERNPEGALV